MRWLWLFVGIASFLDAATGRADEPAPAPPSAAQIQQWIRNLDSERYQAREDATAGLLRGGYDAVGPVAEAAAHGGLEVAIRAVFVLREAALAEDAKTADAAEQALQKLAEAPGMAAPRAASTLLALGELRERRIRACLAERGAKFQSTRTFLGQPDPLPDPDALWLDQDWKGTEADLDKLKHLTSVTFVTFDGPKATDLWLRHLGEMPAVTSVVLKRGNITDAGLTELKRLPNLQDLHIFFSPITDNSVDLLADLRGLSSLKLYGLKFSADGKERLKTAFAQTATAFDLRGGAFLGISGNPHPSGCMVYYMRDGSAAAKGGLQMGDIIVAYDGKRVKDFEGLTALIAEHGPGETAELDILRNGVEMKKKVVLGAWD